MLMSHVGVPRHVMQGFALDAIIMMRQNTEPLIVAYEAHLRRRLMRSDHDVQSAYLPQ